MARIKVIDYSEATGRLKEIYDDLIARRGKLASVHTIQSLRPESIVKHMELYLEIMFSRSELSRVEREMIAVIVSVNNQCDYCRMHHAEALNNYWKNEGKIQSLISDFNNAGLTEKEILLCRFAKILTLDPGTADKTDLTLPLKQAGFSDSAILDATLVTAYFNFVNRIVSSLNVEIESGGAGGYNY